MKIKLLTVLGARPQFIKAGVLSRNISFLDDFEEIVVHTGQHYDKNMSDIFFSQLKLSKPHYSLNSGGKSHGEMTGYQIIEIEKILRVEKPNYVVVYGDTNSTLAGALAAVKLQIPVVHIEAGLRSNNLEMPEEINRILVDRISKILFCPTDQSLKNLNQEGFEKFKIKLINVGDIMFEGALFYEEMKVKPKEISQEKDFILATFHRQENTNDTEKLENIISAFKKIAKIKLIIVPLHPRTRAIIEENKIDTRGIKFINPVSYLEMIWLLKKCMIVITDSGGLQKEAYFFKKPCITLREETEWVELVDLKANILVGADEKKIFDALKLDWFYPDAFNEKMYGDGNTSSEIIKYLRKDFHENNNPLS